MRIATICLVTLTFAGCASVGAVENANHRDSTCAVRVFSDQIEVLDSNRVVELPRPNLWTAEGVTADGRMIVSRESELDLTTLTATPINPELPGTVVDVSANGSKVLLLMKGANNRQQLVIFDREKQISRPLSVGVTAGAISPDGTSLAEQLGRQVRAYRETKLLIEVEGRFPSWLDADTLAYLRPSNDYELVNTQTGQRRILKPIGKPLMPVQHSTGTEGLLYASQTRSDFWSLNFRCPERYRLVVHERESGPGSVVGFGCKATRPESIRWVDTEKVCSAK